MKGHRRMSRRFSSRPVLVALLPASLMALAALAALATAPSASALTDQDVAALSAGPTPTPAAGAPAGGVLGDKKSDALDMNLPEILGRMALAMGVVFALMGVAVWMARRWLPKGTVGRRAGGVEILVNRSIGSRRSLLLVRARGKTLLLGVTPQSIRSLAELEEEGAWNQAAWQSGLEEEAANREPIARPFPSRAPFPAAPTRPSDAQGGDATPSERLP
jgi:flagellar biogenesis protein FliO